MGLDGADLIFIRETQYGCRYLLGLFRLLIAMLGRRPRHRHYSGGARAGPSWGNKNDIYRAYGRSRGDIPPRLNVCLSLSAIGVM